MATPEAARPARQEGACMRALRVWKYRYDLATALYMLEPWERALFNGVVLCVLAYVVYGMYHKALHPLFETIASSFDVADS